MDIIIQNLNLSLATGLQNRKSVGYSPSTKENCSDGVYIRTESGNLWLPQFFGLCEEKATSVALINSEKKLLVSLRGSDKAFSLLPEDKKSSLKKFSSIDEALIDFSGYENTENLLKEGSLAAEYCKELGPSWYIPALGEKNAMFEKKKEIDAALTIAGGEPLYDGWHWTSTRCSDKSYWVLYWDDGDSSIYNQSYHYRVRPVSAFL